MTHVTVVQVQEPCLGQVSKGVNQAEILQVMKEGRQSVCNAGSFTPKDRLTSVAEVLYVNVMELKQQVPESIPETRCPRGVLSSNVDTLRSFPKLNHSRRLSRKSSIMNQNVGVTGGVFMKSDPNSDTVITDESDSESDSSLSASMSSLSGSDSGLSSTIEVGMSPSPKHSTTITIGDQVISRQNAHGNEALLCHKTEGNESLPRQNAVFRETMSFQNVTGEDEISDHRGILLHVSPKHIDSSEDENEITSSHNHEEIISIEYSNFEVSEDLSEAAVTLEWRVIPPNQGVLRQQASLELEGDRGSTPTSFSSAYTVTEHESESTSEEFEISRNNWSGQESDEDTQEERPSLSNVDEGRTHRIRGPHSSNEEANISLKKDDSSAEIRFCPTLSDSLVKEAVLSAVPSVLRRLRHPSDGSSSGEESIVYSYIPCRDQREKEDEELWVANEAADPRGAQTFDGTTPPLLPPPEGWGGSIGRVAGEAKRSSPGTVFAEQLSSEDGCTPSRVASIMCTVAPTITSEVGVPAPPRKHYSTRQRTAETQILKFKVVEEEKKYKDNWKSLSDDKEKANLPTSSTTSKPTKRFSFLVRSNSVKQEEAEVQKVGEESTATGTPEQDGVPKEGHLNGRKDSVTPSDQAILDKLASLNIETPAEVKVRSKPRVSLFDPPCARCGEPVYPQERTEPTLRLVFHSSCFKCHHCGVRLTLKTFFRSPLDSRDTRLFCRSHVPTLDPGKLDSTSSSGKSSPDSAASDTQSESSRGRSSVPATCIHERLEIVKCDTIGLRYF